MNDPMNALNKIIDVIIEGKPRRHGRRKKRWVKLHINRRLNRRERIWLKKVERDLNKKALQEALHKFTLEQLTGIKGEYPWSPLQELNKDE